MFRRHPQFNVADNIFFWRGVCEMYEQSYCSLFYDQCSFCFMMFAPQKRHFYSFDDIIDLPRFEIVVVVAQ